MGTVAYMNQRQYLERLLQRDAEVQQQMQLIGQSLQQLAQAMGSMLFRFDAFRETMRRHLTTGEDGETFGAECEAVGQELAACIALGNAVLGVWTQHDVPQEAVAE
jgi:hypothetical protein